MRICFRHFALRARHPRALPTALAAEAAARQGAFWAFHDALYADQGRLDDPHLWARCERLGLDVERFEADRRDPAIAERVERDVREAMRAGAATTPALVVGDERPPGGARSRIPRDDAATDGRVRIQREAMRYGPQDPKADPERRFTTS